MPVPTNQFYPSAWYICDLFSCFTLRLKENVGGLLGGHRVCWPPSQIIGGLAPLAPLCLHLCILLTCYLFMFQLFKEHKSLRRAFRKLDRGFKGYLSVKDFRAALQMCNISFSKDDLYHILTEFDHNLDGKISYDNFLKTMLTT